MAQRPAIEYLSPEERWKLEMLRPRYFPKRDSQKDKELKALLDDKTKTTGEIILKLIKNERLFDYWLSLDPNERDWQLFSKRPPLLPWERECVNGNNCIAVDRGFKPAMEYISCKKYMDLKAGIFHSPECCYFCWQYSIDMYIYSILAMD